MPAGVSAYVPLANITLGTTAATVTFSSISQAYRDLVLVISPQCTTANYLNIRLNSVASGYNMVDMYGNGSTTASSNFTNQTELYGNNAPTINGDSIYIFNIMDYSITDKHKTVLMRVNKATVGVEAVAARWANTAAVTSILVRTDGGVYAAGSTFALYGVSA